MEIGVTRISRRKLLPLKVNFLELESQELVTVPN